MDECFFVICATSCDLDWVHFDEVCLHAIRLVARSGSPMTTWMSTATGIEVMLLVVVFGFASAGATNRIRPPCDCHASEDQI